MPASRNLIQRLLKGQSFGEWFTEFLRFCVVGLGAYFVDVGLFNVLAHSDVVSLPGDQSMVAMFVAGSVAVVFAWVVSRLGPFRDERRTAKRREFTMFVLVNLGGMLIALVCLWISRYGLGLRSQFADNISANVVGLALGTAFRYVMYRYVVFSDDKDRADVPEGADEATGADVVIQPQ